MLTEEEKTPTIQPAHVLASVATPASVIRRSPPPGRPPGTLSLAELRERIAADVSRMTMAEHERQRIALRAELMNEARAARSFGIAALVVNAITIFAIVGLVRGKLGWLSGVGVGAAEALVLGAVWALVRRGRPSSFSLIRLP
jgi:hypothetical protein